MLAEWNAMDSTLKAAAIGALATSAAAIFGFGGVIFTIIVQGRQSRGAIAEGERRKLNAAMYEDALKVMRSMADAAIELSTDLRMMSMQITSASHAAEAGIPYNLPSARFPYLSTSYKNFADAAIKAILLIENRLIIDPRLVVFCTALTSVLHDTRQLMYRDFVICVMPNIPTDRPLGGLFPYTPPMPALAQTIAELSKTFIDALGDAVAYSEDLLIALQNLLLGDLFNNKVPARKPIDPNQRSVTLDKSDELEKWFRTSTPWGREMAKVKTDTAARFSEQEARAIKGGPA